MCSCSIRVNERKNIRGWEKWSSNDTGLARCIAASCTTCGYSMKAPASALAFICCPVRPAGWSGRPFRPAPNDLVDCCCSARHGS